MVKKFQRRCFMALVAASVLIPMWTAPAEASTTKNNTFILSGQAKGTLTLNKSETCASGNIYTSDGYTTIRVYLSDPDIKPTKDIWYLLFNVKGKTVKFPTASPTGFTLGANSGASTVEQWSAGGKLGSGTMKFGKGFKSGSMRMTLAPAVGQKVATMAEKIVGSWSC